jgi:hypothetical protein
MKKLILFPLIFIGLALSAQRYHYEDFAADTSTNADTIYFTVSKVITDAGQYGAYFVADSLSGATAGTLAYQVSTIGSSDWHTVGTATINGTQTTGSKEARLYGNKFRIRVIGSGTQSTRVKPIFIFKRDY